MKSTTPNTEDPFSKNLLDWKDETLTIQPIIPKSETKLCNQPKSEHKVKQSKENKNLNFVVRRDKNNLK